MLIDTSILIPVFRDKSGSRREQLRRFLRSRSFFLTRFTQLELLQGCRSQAQWERLHSYLEGQDYIEMELETWADAALLFFELKTKGKTIRSMYDCCIAQLAIENRLTLVHNDNDFEAIADARRLRLHRLDLQ